jgi:hypothetical protein
MAGAATRGILFTALLTTAPALAVDEPTEAAYETVVEDHAARERDGSFPVVTRAERHTSTPEDALEVLPGALLLRSGGPLAPARLEVRGLTGPRVAVDVDGLPMSDPLDGALDAAMLPLFFADGVRAGSSTTFAGVSLQSSLPIVDLVTLRAGVGTLETIDLSGTAALVADDENAAVRAGLRVARTSGDFAFAPRGPTGALGPTMVRANNDQTRAVGVARGRAALLPGIDVESVMLLANHEGGVPGFATAPTDGQRSTSTIAAVGATLRATSALAGGHVVIEAMPGLRTTTRSTVSRAGPSDGITIDERGLGARVRTTDVVPGLVVDVVGRAALAAVREHAHARRTTSGALTLRQQLFGEAVALSGSADVAALSDVGPLAGGHVGVDGGGRLVRVHVRATRRARAPTLDELYAPRGFVEGNTALTPETLTEIEGGGHFDLSRIIKLDAAVFGGRLDEAILYVNRNAYVVAPVNTGPAWRAGGELALDARPHRFLGIDTRARLLLSLVEATGAPLPVAPPFHARTTLRLGALSGPHVATIVHARGGSSANLFGTLNVAPYTLTDVVAVWPILPSLSLSGALTNIFDVRDAQDGNLLPLPGRQLFVALEVVR